LTGLLLFYANRRVLAGNLSSHRLSLPGPGNGCGPSCETAYPEDASAWSLIRTTASRPMLARPVRERIGTSRSFLRRQRHRLQPAKRFQQFSWH